MDTRDEDQGLDDAARAAAMRDGRLAVERGAYFEAHEHWERVWSVATGDERRWIQGLIQLAAAAIKLEARQREPAERLLRKAVEKLADAPEGLDGVDVRAARDTAIRLLECVQRGELPDARVAWVRGGCTPPRGAEP